jgi:hypothetical protein
LQHGHQNHQSRREGRALGKEQRVLEAFEDIEAEIGGGAEERQAGGQEVENVRERLAGDRFVTQADVERDLAALRDHLANPGVQVISNIFFRLTGRLPS